jgi:undecaprenyl phosphate N,N'-diacetylbacillosamine 1-phosphate transferase
MKRVFDLLVSTTLLILLWPVIFIIAIIIKLDRGPVFFIQKRLGLYGKCFKIYKFRSMVVDADKYLDEKGMSTIDRITKFGNFMRKTSIDEIPQLFNIIRGDMSIVGPRPTLVEHYNLYSDEQKRRFEMRPGVTGLAQINGRNTLKWTKRLEYDVEYIDKYSLWLDLKILLKTVGVVLRGDGIVLDRNASQVNDLDS